jgi:hypothetical protein
LAVVAKELALDKLRLRAKANKNQSEGIVPQSSELIKQVVLLLGLHRAIFGQERVYVRAVLLVVSEIFAFRGHRVTDLLRGVGLVREDWSAWYRVWEKPGRFVEEWAGQILVRESLSHVKATEPYVIGIDCTQVWRDSQTLEGSAWLKCGRTPPWKVGIHRAQRFLNGSWLTPLSVGFCRAIPLRWLPAFPAKAVLKEHVAVKEHAAGLDFVAWVRARLNGEGRQQQRVVCLADGAYDKPDFWRGLPAHVTALVRTAKNRALCYFPAPYPGSGRRRSYGEKAPAPQAYNQLRTGWHTDHLTVRGHSRRTVYRVEGPFLRRGMPGVPLFLIVVRGQHYTRYGHTKQRDPVFYSVNALQQDGHWVLPLPALTLLTWAWQRWELEVVHREVKSIFGLGDKQCFQPHAAVSSVQWSAWCYALLTLAAFRTFGLPHPPTATTAWYPHPKRWTFSSLLDALRADLWGHPLFSQFLSPAPKDWPKIEAILLDFFSQALCSVPLTT